MRDIPETLQETGMVFQAILMLASHGKTKKLTCFPKINTGGSLTKIGTLVIPSLFPQVLLAFQILLMQPLFGVAMISFTFSKEETITGLTLKKDRLWKTLILSLFPTGKAFLIILTMHSSIKMDLLIFSKMDNIGDLMTEPLRLTKPILHFQDRQEFGGLVAQAVPEPKSDCFYEETTLLNFLALFSTNNWFPNQSRLQ